MNGWRLLGTMDDAQVEKLPREGVATYDPIAAAHKVALIALRQSGHPAEDQHPGQEPPPPRRTCGRYSCAEIDRRHRRPRGPAVEVRESHSSRSSASVSRLRRCPTLRRRTGRWRRNSPMRRCRSKRCWTIWRYALLSIPDRRCSSGPRATASHVLRGVLDEISGLHVVRFDGAGASEFRIRRNAAAVVDQPSPVRAGGRVAGGAPGRRAYFSWRN